MLWSCVDTVFTKQNLACENIRFSSLFAPGDEKRMFSQAKQNRANSFLTWHFLGVFDRSLPCTQVPVICMLIKTKMVEQPRFRTVCTCYVRDSMIPQTKLTSGLFKDRPKIWLSILVWGSGTCGLSRATRSDRLETCASGCNSYSFRSLRKIASVWKVFHSQPRSGSNSPWR